MHAAPLLGRDDVAGDFRLVAAARHQQIERRALLQPGKADSEAARLLQRRGTQQMERRDQRRVAGERLPQQPDQPVASPRAKRVGESHRARRQLGDPAFGDARRAVEAAQQLVDRQLHRVALEHRLAGARSGAGLPADIAHAFRPCATTDEVDECLADRR